MRRIAVLLAIAVAFAIPGIGGILAWDSVLSGSNEIPPAATSGSGYGRVIYDDTSNILSLYVEWQNLTGPGLQAHIHCCVATPPGNVGIALDLWLTSDPARPATGVYVGEFDLDLVNPFRAAFTTANGGTTAGALQALINAMNAENRAYYNIHTSQFPGGEIRGNLEPAPEPSTVVAVLGGLGLLFLRRRLSR